MKCPVCRNETSASSPYCEYCGAEISRDFEIVSEEFVRETEEEKIRKIEEEIRNYLVFVLFLFLVAFSAYVLIPVPSKVTFSPVYFAEEPPVKPKVVEEKILVERIPE